VAPDAGIPVRKPSTEATPYLPGLTWAWGDGPHYTGYFRPALRKAPRPDGDYQYVVQRKPDFKWVTAHTAKDIPTAEPFDSPEEVMLWLQMQGYDQHG
jgi:hypothetical protein